MSLEEVVEEARKLLDREIEKYGGSYPEIITEKAVELAEKFDANKEIAIIGTYLMDLKTKEAAEKGKLDEHVKMSLEATEDFLERFDLDTETEEKIKNCVEAHHFNVPFKCKEAEICANADCYRFLHPRGFLTMSATVQSKFGIEEGMDILEEKIEEKYENVSLDICKEEVEKYYPVLKKLLKYARE